MITKDLGTTAVPVASAGTLVTNEVLKLAIQYVATGAPSALVADLEGSLDGSTWGVVETHTFSADELTALSKFVFVTDKPLPYFRVSIKTLTLIAREVTDIVITGAGDGLLSVPTAVDSAPVETWTVTCTVGGPAGTFSVVGSISGAQTNATSATPYNNSIVTFTITDGATAWEVGDVITFDVNIVGGVTTLVRFDDIKG